MMKNLILISALLLLISCSNKPNTQLLCECDNYIKKYCTGGPTASVEVNESNKLFIVHWWDLTNIAFNERKITGEYLTDKGKWVHEIDRTNLTIIRWYWEDDYPIEQFRDTYQCKIVDVL